MSFSAVPSHRSRLLAVAALVVMVGLPSAAVSENSPDLESRARSAAVEAMKSWLTLVDQKSYPTSYQKASAFFQKSLSKQQWIDACKKVRHPFGALRNRRLLGASYLGSLSDGTNGPFVIAQFRADFDNQTSAVETVTFQLDNGDWKASGYYLRLGL